MKEYKPTGKNLCDYVEQSFEVNAKLTGIFIDKKYTLWSDKAHKNFNITVEKIKETSKEDKILWRGNRSLLFTAMKNYKEFNLLSEEEQTELIQETLKITGNFEFENLIYISTTQNKEIAKEFGFHGENKHLSWLHKIILKPDVSFIDVRKHCSIKPNNPQSNILLTVQREEEFIILPNHKITLKKIVNNKNKPSFAEWIIERK